MTEGISCAALQKTMNVFVCSVMKVNTSLHTDLKMSFKCL